MGGRVEDTEGPMSRGTGGRKGLAVKSNSAESCWPSNKLMQGSVQYPQGLVSHPVKGLSNLW